ncbi:MAG: PEP-CTERM sorting domain-containing protein [Cephaloticoccus sp.]|nr:PEP-CTERM sorting domain-containing protein [Cephaloticoccus sp.]MCF7759249.1 PEP-CTERM sorting domain-containing protein [Cephaloticoccus sp.]
MRIRTGLALLFAFTFASQLLAQNFSGSDDFLSVNSNWTVPSGSSVLGAAMTVNGGALNFTSPSLTTGQTSEAAYAWTANNGSYTADWQLQVDFNVNTTLVAGQIGLWELIVGSTTTPANNFTVALQRTYMQLIGSQPPQIQAYTKIDGGIQAPGYVSANASAGTATVRIAYNAAATTLTAAYDGNGPTDGYAFTNLHSVNISDVASDWNMVSGDTFSVVLHAFNSANGDPSMPLFEGAFIADNFLATPTAVPEPATIALLAGLGALGLALWRRCRV